MRPGECAAAAVRFIMLGAVVCLGQSAPITAIPDGSVLLPGDVCYTITATNSGVEQPIGLAFQSIQRTRTNGVDTLAVVVHQRLSSLKIDIRDSFLLRAADLKPIRLDSERDGTPHVHLDYTADRVSGWKMVNGVKQPIDVTFDGPVWEGNLWGVTFAALPLKHKGIYHLPEYQYDSGKGSFLVTVTGSKKMDTPQGPVQAWVLNAGLEGSEQAEYLVAGKPPRELGYTSGPMSQHLGGDCTQLH